MTDLATRLADATERLQSTVTALPDDDWGAPSVCVDWSRADVIAHLALNAEGLAGAVRGLVRGAPATMYRSDEARDADIAELAAAPPDQVRERLRAAVAGFADAVAGLPSLPTGATFERTPGGIRMSAAAVPALRLREVEIHHADLRAGYDHSDWPTPTVVDILDRETGGYEGAGIVLRATDLDRDWVLGSPADAPPVVSGPASALAWWTTGRPVPEDGPGAVLSCSTGQLPALEGR